MALKTAQRLVILFKLTLIVVLAAAVCTSAAGGKKIKGDLIDRIEVIVETAPITFCEIEAEARIALARRQGVNAAGDYISASLHDAVREYLINQYIVITEANLLQIFNVTEEEMDRELFKFKQNFKNESEYITFIHNAGINESFLRETFARNLRVEKFLEYRMKTEVYISPTETIAYYNQNKERFGAQSYDEVKKVILKYLEVQKKIKVKQAWLKRLREHRDIITVESSEDTTPVCRFTTL